MPQYIEFHFDLTSPYGYLGPEQIEPLADRDACRIKWRPFCLLGGEPFSGGDRLLRIGRGLSSGDF